MLNDKIMTMHIPTAIPRPFADACSRVQRFASSACLAFLAAVGVVSSLSAAAPSTPNIVFILADDMGYGDLACFGHSEIKTPHLDRLAAGGLKLTQSYSAAAVCSPARAGILFPLCGIQRATRADRHPSAASHSEPAGWTWAN
jgi:hypothetical protein